MGFWESDAIGETQHYGHLLELIKHTRLPRVGSLPQHTVMSKGRT